MFCKDSFQLIFNFATNSDKFGIFWSYWGLFCLNFYFLTFISMNIMVKTSFGRSMGHKCVLGCTYVLQILVSIVFFPILRQIVTNLAFFGSFGAFFCMNFYFWTFIPMNIMVKTSFERSMGHKCVLGCTYVLQRFIFHDFFKFCDKP